MNNRKKTYSPHIKGQKSLAGRSVVGSFGSTIHNVLDGGGNRIISFVKDLIYYIISIGALSVKIFFRRKLGERVLTAESLFFAVLYVLFFYKIYNFLFSVFSDVHGMFASIHGMPPFENNSDDMQENEFLKIYAIIVFVFGLIHLYHIRKRRKNNIRVHSYYRGESAFFKRKKDSFTPEDEEGVRIYLYTEPTMVFIVGLLSLYVNNGLGVLLMIGALCLLLEEYWIYKRNRYMILDLIDREIEGEHITMVREYYNKVYKDSGYIITTNLPNGTVTLADASEEAKYIGGNSKNEDFVKIN